MDIIKKKIEPLKLKGTENSSRVNSKIKNDNLNRINVDKYFKDRYDENFTDENQQRLEKVMKNLADNDKMTESKINEIIEQVEYIKYILSKINTVSGNSSV